MLCGEFRRVRHGSAAPAGLCADDAVDRDGGVGQAQEGYEDGGGVVGCGCVFGEDFGGDEA